MLECVKQLKRSFQVGNHACIAQNFRTTLVTVNTKIVCCFTKKKALDMGLFCTHREPCMYRTKL